MSPNLITATERPAPSRGQQVARPAAPAERAWQRRRDQRIAAAAEAGWLAALR